MPEQCFFYVQRCWTSCRCTLNCFSISRVAETCLSWIGILAAQWECFVLFSQWILGFQQQWTTAITVTLEAKHICASGGKGYTHQCWAWFLAHHNRCVANAHKLFNGSGRTALGRSFCCLVLFSRVRVRTPNLLSRWILTKWRNCRFLLGLHI